MELVSWLTWDIPDGPQGGYIDRIGLLPFAFLTVSYPSIVPPKTNDDIQTSWAGGYP